MIERIGEEKG